MVSRRGKGGLLGPGIGGRVIHFDGGRVPGSVIAADRIELAARFGDGERPAWGGHGGPFRPGVGLWLVHVHACDRAPDREERSCKPSDDVQPSPDRPGSGMVNPRGQGRLGRPSVCGRIVLLHRVADHKSCEVSQAGLMESADHIDLAAQGGRDDLGAHRRSRRDCFPGSSDRQGLLREGGDTGQRDDAQGGEYSGRRDESRRLADRCGG